MHQWTLAQIHLTMEHQEHQVEAAQQVWSTVGYAAVPPGVPVIIVTDLVGRHVSLQMLGPPSRSWGPCCSWLLWLALKKSPFNGGTIALQVHLLEKQCQQRLRNQHRCKFTGSLLFTIISDLRQWWCSKRLACCETELVSILDALACSIGGSHGLPYNLQSLPPIGNN